ncbi:hypothetical protein FRC07_014600, partial [Ceratobasidium sp. 392]
MSALVISLPSPLKLDRTHFTRSLSSRVRLRLTMMRYTSLMFASTVQDEDVARSAFEKALKQITDDFNFKTTFTTVLRKQADQGVLGSEIFPIIAVMLTESNLIELLAGTLASNLSGALTSMLEEQQTKITLLSPDGAASSETRMLATKFQESYIKQRIEAHARR